MLARAVPGFMPVAVVVAMIVLAGVTRHSMRIGPAVLVLNLIIVVGEALMLARAVPGFMPVAVVVAMIVVAGVARDCRWVGAVVLVFVFVYIVVVVGEVVM